MLYDVKGRFTLTKIKEKEAEFKLCKVKRRVMGQNKIPYLITHDARCLRYPDPAITVNDVVKVNFKTGKVEETYTLDIGNHFFSIALYWNNS
jgi:small subunit ribosomal protein S4e